MGAVPGFLHLPEFFMPRALPVIVILLMAQWTPLRAIDPPVPAARGKGRVLVELIEGIDDKRSWKAEKAGKVAEEYEEPAFAFRRLPKKYSPTGLISDRSNPFLLRARGRAVLPAGECRILLRSFNSARLFVDGKLAAETRFRTRNADGHEDVPETRAPLHPDNPPLPPGHAEKLVKLELKEGLHDILLEAVIGGKGLRSELGELVVAFSGGEGAFEILAPADENRQAEAAPFALESWLASKAKARRRIDALDNRNRRRARRSEDAYWDKRHRMARELLSKTLPPNLPEVSPGVTVSNPIDRFIGARLEKAGIEPAPLLDDAGFLRRLSLDVRGVVPSLQEVNAFFSTPGEDRRARWVERMLSSRDWADHWVPYWQDVLAENPGILKPKLNNTGPFRWWLREAFLDGISFDRLVTELVLMRGSKHGGAPAGFAMASQNDVPMAAKAHILSTAFLAVELKCARCHDAPYHPYKQKDLFSLAAMLKRGALQVPKTSSVPRSKKELEEMIVEVTLAPGSKVKPAWPFTAIAPREVPESVLRSANDTRERLAAVITSGENTRFARVIVNRLWKRYMGHGLVEPVDDWNKAEASHPALLDWLARELILNDYDLKAVARLVLNSSAYGREAAADERKLQPPARRLFAGPARRRMSAEQLVDSLFRVTGKAIGSEEMNFDIDGRRPIDTFLNLGTPARAWEFASLSNERDRPALAKPVAQSVIDLLRTFGWREARQSPLTVRDHEPNALQPLTLANGIIGHRAATLSDDSALTALCLEEKPLPRLVEETFLSVLSRQPSAEELNIFSELLAEGYKKRIAASGGDPSGRKARKRHAVSWSNHLSVKATRIKLEMERLARAGDPPTNRIEAGWRERYEDMLWALFNSPEFIFLP